MQQAPDKNPSAQFDRDARTLSPARIRPRDAATLIIIDRSRRVPRFLMGRRNPSLRFMPGKFVFPGGRIEMADRHMRAYGALAHRVEAALAARVRSPSQQRGRALVMAAIREAYEETGLFLGTRDHGPPDGVKDGPWSAFRDRGVLPVLEEMHFIARAITPPGRPRRFDTRFFAVDRDAVTDEAPGMIGPDKEFVEMAWVDPKEARALDLPQITRWVLDDLDGRIAQGFSHDLPVPFYYERHGKRVRDLI